MNKLRAENGSTTVLALAITAVAIFIFSAIAMGFSVAYEYRKAEQAADLSALAGAAKVIMNPAESCQLAKEIARLNNAVIDSCEIGFEEIAVKVRSTRFGWIRASAKAGIF